jgi:hypothetical protein
MAPTPVQQEFPVSKKHDWDVRKPDKNINYVDYRENILACQLFDAVFFLTNFPEQRCTWNFHCTIYLQKSETDRLNNIIVEGTNRKIFFLLCAILLKKIFDN